MKNNYIILLLCFFTTCIKGQNLVPNSSFESHTSCPVGGGEIIFAAPWSNPNTASPDYFHSCGATGFKAPLNFRGYQDPRTGNAYAGISVYGSIGASSAREYIQVLLTDTLIVGKLYCVSFYVSQCGISSFGGGYNPVAISEVGLLFSNNSITTSNYFPLPYTPQIVSPTDVIIDDTTNWVEISAIYTAIGGERYITIGNFKNDASTDTAAIDTSGSNPQGYYYVDDVSVIDCDSLVGINEHSKFDRFIIYPNPSSGLMTLEYHLVENETGSVEVYDFTGRILKRYAINSKNTQLAINSIELSAGQYYYAIRVNGQLVKTEKLTIIK